MNNIKVEYQKIYTDDAGKRMEDVFGKNIEIQSLWGGAIDAFYKFTTDLSIMGLEGDIRIVLAKEDADDKYKFRQFFLSGFDGKIISIMKDTWFGVQNLNCSKTIYSVRFEEIEFEDEFLNPNIFNWHLKH